MKRILLAAVLSFGAVTAADAQVQVFFTTVGPTAYTIHSN